MRRRLSLLALIATVAVGCSDGTEPDSDELFELIGRDWTVAPGQELYKCIGIRVDRDLYLSHFETANPLGEHHAVLTVSDQLPGFGGTKLGEHDCSVLTLDLQMLYASGVGTAPLTLPEGVAIRVRAGQYLHLNLHLFNTTDTEISARSTILARRMSPVPAERQAEMVFAGTFDINVPSGETRTAGGGCTFTRDATLFAYFPHMHQHATHQTVTMTIGGQPRTIHDQAYEFGEQRHVPLVPALDVHAGDSIRVECTYTNTSAMSLHWGDSSTEEMCFTGLYRFPRQASTLFECTEGGP